MFIFKIWTILQLLDAKCLFPHRVLSLDQGFRNIQLIAYILDLAKKPCLFVDGVCLGFIIIIRAMAIFWVIFPLVSLPLCLSLIFLLLQDVLEFIEEVDLTVGLVQWISLIVLDSPSDTQLTTSRMDSSNTSNTPFRTDVSSLSAFGSEICLSTNSLAPRINSIIALTDTGCWKAPSHSPTRLSTESSKATPSIPLEDSDVAVLIASVCLD